MKKYFILPLLVVFFTFSAHAADPKKPAEVRYVLNHGYGATAQLGTQVVDNSLRTVKGKFKLANDPTGGNIGSVSLLDTDGKAVILPQNAVIVNCIVDTITAPASTGSPTIAFTTGQAAADLKAATSDYNALESCIPDGTAANAIKLTQDYTPSATIAVAPVSTAEISVLIQYILSE